jgi:hypothetical protein
VAGGAWLVAFKLSHDPADLERAVDDLQGAYDNEPTGPRASNLAAALLEWTGLPERDGLPEIVDAHGRAVLLLEQALIDTGEDDPSWVTRATILLGAYADAIDGRFPGFDIDKTLDFGERVVAAAARLDVGGGEPANLLGGALVSVADLGHPRGDLDRAVALLRTAVDALPGGHLDLPSRRSNLGAALMDRYERTGHRRDLAEAIGLQRQALADRIGHRSARLRYGIPRLWANFQHHYQVTLALTPRGEGNAGTLACRCPAPHRLLDVLGIMLPAEPDYDLIGPGYDEGSPSAR